MKKLLITLSLIFLFVTPSIFAETVPDIPAGTAEDYYNRGNQFKDQGNFIQAIDDYSKAIKLNSKHVKAYYNRGNSYGKQGKLSDAIEDYKKAVAINPQYTEAYYNMGNTYEKQGNLEEAIMSYTKALETNPKYSAAYCNRGNVHQAQGNLQQALDDYSKAIEINPSFAGVYSNRGNVYFAQGNTEKAITDYNKAIDLNPHAGFYANRGNIYQNMGNLQKAIADYNKAIEKDPNDSSPFYNRGLAYYALDEYEKSLADYTTAANKDPDKEAYDDFMKYFPTTKESDKGNIRGQIVQLFEDKLNLTKKLSPPVAAAPADAIPPVSAPPKESTELSSVIPPVTPPVVPPVIAQSTPTADVNPTTNTGKETKLISQSDAQILVNKWLNSWRSGDMGTYRSCYDEKFESKNMNLDAWITYKTNVRDKSKNIKILIDDLKISYQGDTAKAVFIQSYSSSLINNKGKKTLELKKVNNEWKIYREMM